VTATGAGDSTIPADAVRLAAEQALLTGVTHYTERAGIPIVRQQLARLLSGAGGLDPERVVITGGLEECLFLALSALVPRGGYVISSTPERDRELLASVGLELGEAGDSGVAALLVHVDGAVAAGSLLDAVDHGQEAGLTVIVAEDVTLSAAGGSLAGTGLADRVVLLGELMCCGAGGGYLIGPPELLEPIVELKQGLNICTAGHAQYATLAAAGVLLPVSDGVEPEAALPLGGVRSASAGGGGPRRSSVSDEGTRQRYELLDLLRQTPGAISLGRGDPDLETPRPIVDAAIASLRHARAAEPHPLGMPALRIAIAAKLSAENAIEVDPDSQLLVTTGGQEAIFLAIQALARPGDEILMPAPRYTTYDVAVNVAGARIVSVPPRGPLDFRLDASAIEPLITSRTRALLIITPGNPTAAVADHRRLVEIGELARRHGLTVISDEMYERIVYDGIEHTSIGSFPESSETTVTVGGFSKAYAMTGWRVGYLAGPRSLVAAASRLKRLWSGPTPELSQHGALAALSWETDLAAEALAEYASRRAIALAALDQIGLPYAPSEGAFYAFFDVTSLGIHSYELSRRLLTEAGVFLYPGSGFGDEWSGYMRMAWLAPEARLREALEQLANWVGKNT
jgi:aminotransferase